MAMGQGRTDRVFVYWSNSDDPFNHIGRTSWAQRDRYFYEVDPVGDLEPDPDPTALLGFHCCLEAVVIRCLFSPDMKSPLEG
jgi:hypothetical protein